MGRYRALGVLGSGAVIGVAIPLAWAWIATPDVGTPHIPGSGVTPVLAGVVASYLLLTVLVSRISARARARSRSRRMRHPWERGLTEWQPAGWTYHACEEALVAAALSSTVTCLALFMLDLGVGA